MEACVTALKQSALERTGVRPQVRMLQLDMLRGMAILLVIGRHPVVPPKAAGIFLPFAGVWARFGWAGVDLFFVLSGFLVGSLLLNELRQRSEINFQRFIIRRCFKIWPSYYVYLVFVLLLFSAQSGWVSGQNAWLLIPSFLHVQNYFPMPRTHLWSLAVEEHFYIGLPLLLLFLTGRRGKGHASVAALPVILSVMIACCIAFRLIVNAHRPFTFDTHFNPTHVRVDGLLFGVLLAYLHIFKTDWMKRAANFRAPLIAFGIALLIPMMVFKMETTPFVTSLGYTMLYLGFGAILVALIHTPVGTGLLGACLATGPARWLGVMGSFSYPIYLWHVDLAHNPIVNLLARGFLADASSSARWFVATVIYVALAIFAGWILSVIVEKPALAIRDWLYPRQAEALSFEDVKKGMLGL